jgi:hypothetical protein
MIALPSCSAIVCTTATPSRTSWTVPVTVISRSGRPMPRNCTCSLRRLCGPPPASVCARATCAIVHRPCRILPGRPTCLAKSSSMWIGLKSPDAPA